MGSLDSLILNNGKMVLGLPKSLGLNLNSIKNELSTDSSREKLHNRLFICFT
jgi:hypothetical protein